MVKREPDYEILGISVFLDRNEKVSPYWYFYCRIEGKKYRQSTKETDYSRGKVKSEDIILEKLHNLTHNIPNDTPSKKNLTFDNLYKKYISDLESLGRSHLTIEDYNKHYKYLSEFLGRKPVKSLGNRSVYNEFYQWRKNYHINNQQSTSQTYRKRVRGRFKKVEGREYTEVGKTQIDKEIQLLVRVLRWGQENELITDDVIIKPYQSKYRKTDDTLTLEREEYLEVLEYFKNKKYFYYLLVRFLNNTGCRFPSEVRKLKWKDINFKEKYILFRDRKQGRSKTPINTYFPITPRIEGILLELKNREGISTKQNDFVFIDKNGRLVGKINKSWKTCLTTLGINPDITPYSLRHLFGRRMVKRSDIPLKTTSQLMGHKSTEMLERVYGKEIRFRDNLNLMLKSEERREKIIEKMEETNKD